MRTFFLFFFFFLGLTPRTFRIWLNFPNFPDELSEFCSTFRIFSKFSGWAFRIFWLLSEFLSTFRILVYFQNFGRKWTRNWVPRFPLFSNSEEKSTLLFCKVLLCHGSRTPPRVCLQKPPGKVVQPEGKSDVRCNTLRKREGNTSWWSLLANSLSFL